MLPAVVSAVLQFTYAVRRAFECRGAGLPTCSGGRLASWHLFVMLLLLNEDSVKLVSPVQHGDRGLLSQGAVQVIATSTAQRHCHVP